MRKHPTKNNEGRVLPFRAIPALQDLMARQREYTTEVEHSRKRIVPFVFHRNGREVRTIARAWGNACEAAGCPGRLFHDCAGPPSGTSRGPASPAPSP